MKWYNKILGAGALALASLTFSQKKAEACSSAIPIGRGGTNVAIADGASAVYWNPAGLIQLERPELDVTAGLGDKYKTFLCYGQPLNKRNAVGINLCYRNIENEGSPDLETLWARVSYSAKLTDKLSIGTNLVIEQDYQDNKLIRYSVDNEEVSRPTFNRDLGVLYRVNDKIKLGLLLQGYAFCHLTSVRPGASLKLDDKTLLAIEGYDITSNNSHTRFGLERKVNDSLSVRAGMRVGKEENSVGNSALLDGRLGGSCGASYRKGDLEMSVSITGSINLTLNKKF